NGVKIVRLQPDGGLLGKLIQWCWNMRGGCRGFNRLLSPSGVDLFLQGPRTFGVIPYLLRSNADVVGAMNWYWPLAHYSYLARRLKPYRLVGIPLFHTAEDWCEHDIYRRMLRSCDAVVTNTEYEAHFCRRHNARNVHAVGVGIHPEDFEKRDGHAVREACHIGTHPVVGFVGRPMANKGITTVIEGMKQVWKTNSEVRLLIAGPKPPSWSPEERQLQEFLTLEKSRVIRICDFTDSDKASIFDALDVFVLPSVGESFGISYLEAWMCGKPVIGADIGPTRDVIHDGVDGVLVKPNDPTALAKNIIALLADPLRREQMGQSGHKKTLARFTWDRIIDKMEHIYREVVEETPKPRW
ncbi:MAG TPA: glycosyltransferase family 4 protein, partial [Nitrospira sp.]|nr:glycosyltransferase family 4 protein [Nitrospira sp.]